MTGRAPSGQALAVPAEPASGLIPPGFDPSRGAKSNNPHNFTGKHYWPADHFSVPADGLCLNMAPSPDTDFLCVRPAGHPGKHEYERSPVIRDFSWRDA